MTKASDNAFPSLLITEGTEPSAPAAGKQRLYIDSTTHLLMLTNSSGTESAVGSGISLGTWTNYTPTLTAVTTNPTLGSSSISGRYKQLDSKTVIVIVNFSVTTGGAWNAGSGEWKFSLPAGMTAGAFGRQHGAAHVLDSGTTHYSATAEIGTSATVIWPILVGDASGSKVLANNSPITWATGDQVDIQVVIELT